MISVVFNILMSDSKKVECIRKSPVMQVEIIFILGTAIKINSQIGGRHIPSDHFDNIMGIPPLHYTINEFSLCIQGEIHEIISEQRLRNIIGRMRDRGLLIVSRHAGGYRIASCIADLHEYLNTQNTVVEPIIARIAKLRETVLRATADHAIDILQRAEYTRLRTVVDALSPLASAGRPGSESN